MRQIKLTFTDARYVDGLISDKYFMQNTAVFLNPIKLDNLNLQFSDPVTQHNYLDTEMVVLSICANAIKRIFFSDQSDDIAFNQSYTGGQKGGINLNGTRIISSTDVQV